MFLFDFVDFGYYFFWYFFDDGGIIDLGLVFEVYGCGFWFCGCFCVFFDVVFCFSFVWYWC